MKLLAMDTATEALSVSLAIGDERIDRYHEIERGHSEQLLPLIDAMLAEAGVALRDLDALVFGRGPGGFTGVRLAASVAQGLAFGAGIGVVPVSDLAAVAQRVIDEDGSFGHVLVANDARMRQVYWAEFEAVSDLAEACSEERVDAPVSVVVNAPAGRWAAAGRGLRAWRDLEARCVQAGAVTFPDLLPRASEMITLAKPLVAGGRVLDPTDALPVYVRDRVAEPPR